MEKDDESHIDRVWEIIEKTGICMMVTRFAGGLHARPLEARPDRDIETIWFLTDVRGLKDDEVEANPNVCLTLRLPQKRRSRCFPPRARGFGSCEGFSLRGF